jgi:hypothetical protein
VAALTMAGLTACGHHSDPAAVEVSRGSCGVGWKSPHGGDQTVQVHNVGPVTMEVELVDPATRGVYAEIESLAADVTALRTALSSGDRARAQRAWLVAQMAYSRLGAAYDTFGDSADAIDGLPGSGSFAGLRRIERGLWHGESLPLLSAVAKALASDVASPRTDFARARTDPNDLPLRAHEILENTLQFELTGAADQGAGDGLAIMSANLDGTRMVLDALAPELRPRYTAVTAALERPGHAAPAPSPVFHGLHQAGVVAPAQPHATHVALDVLATDRAGLEDLFRTITERARFLTAGGVPPEIGIAGSRRPPRYQPGAIRTCGTG